MQSWFSFLQSRQTPSYIAHLQNRYQFFLDLLDCYAKPHEDAIEAGCGSGLITKLLLKQLRLNRRKPFLHLLDDDEKVLSIAKENLADQKKLVIHQHDIREPYLTHRKVGLIFSHGVLEHFSDDEIQTIINHQLSLKPRYMVHYVPSYKYTTPSFGNERLMDENDWMRIAKPTKILPFNDGFDLALTWNTNNV